MMMLGRYVFLLIILFTSLPAIAAFPIKTIKHTIKAEKINATEISNQTHKESLFQKLRNVEKNRIANLSKHFLISEPMAERGTAALLCFLLGWAGVHRFYLGYTWQGVVQALCVPAFILLISSAFADNIDLFADCLLVICVLFIWISIDFIRILIGTLEPKDSKYL